MRTKPVGGGRRPPTASPTEAAWLTELSPKQINASIDRGELRGAGAVWRSGSRRRQLGIADVVYLVLRKELASVLLPDARRELYARLVELSERSASASQRPAAAPDDVEVTLAGGILRVEVKRAWQRVAKRWAALQRATEVVVVDPEIRGGEPVIRGTRVPVYLIADLIGQGASLREILEDYPSLNAAKVRSALAYARTRPRRGRPRRAPWLA